MIQAIKYSAGAKDRDLAVDEDVRAITHAWSSVMRRANSPRVQEQFMRSTGLFIDRSGYWLLRVLGERGRVRLSELAQHDGVEPSTVSRQVRDLEHAGFVLREGDPTDMRAVLVSLTDAGRSALERLQETRVAMFASILADWSPRDRREFARLTRRFAADYLAHVGNKP